MIMCFFVFVSFLSKVNALINGYELLGKIIFLDAGHGGVDAGSSYNDILEKDINLQLVRKLEKEGFVSIINDKNDKRNKNIVLSQKGMEYTKITTEISNELLSTFYKGFSEQEKQTFLDFLERIEKNFEI